MAVEMIWRDAIDKVLGSAGEPMHYKEITERIMSDGLRRNFGATPAATVSAVISMANRDAGGSPPYIRVSRGTFAMATRDDYMSGSSSSSPTIAESEELEEQYDIITSFGMFWRRDAVEWLATPKLLGMQQIGATPVDFNKQLGIYLLYDGREVIYVGRTTDRPLGRRLFEHTIDRMSARWNRFSWFGLLPVDESGMLGELPVDYRATKMIPALEAILIEALEPRQNRKRGDDLAAVEFIQREDPEVQKRKMREVILAKL